MKRLILFLIRKRLHLRKYEPFKFSNQKSKTDFYYFDNDHLMKCDSSIGTIIESHVSLNWILNDDCCVCDL